MLERAFVKRLRDSDSDSEEESNSLMSKTTSEDKPTDILTTDKTSEVRIIAFSGVNCPTVKMHFKNVFLFSSFETMNLTLLSAADHCALFKSPKPSKSLLTFAFSFKCLLSIVLPFH